jgi:hypothetical protein
LFLSANPSQPYFISNFLSMGRLLWIQTKLEQI